MIKFIKEFILAYVYMLLRPIVDILTIPFVAIKHGKGVLNYFNDIGYHGDIDSASKHRALWNFLFVKKDGFKFYRHTEGNTKRTISQILGINEWLNQLTWFGWFIVYLLWIIDYKHWSNGGHCFQSMKAEDFYLPDVVEFLDGTKIYKRYDR